jgi:transposase-like protein
MFVCNSCGYEFYEPQTEYDHENDEQYDHCPACKEDNFERINTMTETVRKPRKKKAKFKTLEFVSDFNNNIKVGTQLAMLDRNYYNKKKGFVSLDLGVVTVAEVKEESFAIEHEAYELKKWFPLPHLGSTDLNDVSVTVYNFNVLNKSKKYIYTAAIVE